MISAQKNMLSSRDFDDRDDDRPTTFDAFAQEDAGIKKEKKRYTGGRRKLGGEQTAKKTVMTRRRRKRETQKRGRHGRETGPR